MSGARTTPSDFSAVSGESALDPCAWSAINRSLVDLMSQPTLASERVSQAVLGEACQVLQRVDAWSELRLQRDGYTGWVQSAALHPATEAQVLAFRAAARITVVADIAAAFASSHRARQVGKVFFGMSLPPAGETQGSVALRLPDGRVWWIAREDTQPTASREPETQAIEQALRLMRSSVGVPYLWGGCTPFGYDCSGLTQAFWSFLGTPIARDADQQFQQGRVVEGPPAAGDLVFFSTEGASAERARHADVRHVGIALGGNELLHASASVRSVAIDRLEVGAGAQGDWLVEHLAGVRRFWECS